MKQRTGFSAVTACGECCTGSPKKLEGLCGEFPCERLTSVIHWNPDIVEHLSAFARQYQEQEG